jgi:hypothetical protein
MTTATPETTALALLNPTDLVLNPDSPEFREHLEAGAVELAAVFRESTEAMRLSWAAFVSSTKRLEAVIGGADDRPYPRTYFDVGLHYSQTGSRESGLDEIIKKMNVQTWELLIDRLGVKCLMSIKRRAEFEKQLKDGDVPAVTAENIVAVIAGLADRAAEFATEAAREALKLLTPASGHYKTNSGFKVGRRAILSWYVERAWSGHSFRINYNRDAEVNAIDGAFHILDEKGVIKGRKCPLATAIESSEDGRGETDYFRFRCFKNRNLHIEFKRLDLVKKLNGLATGEYVLGQDID